MVNAIAHAQTSWEAAMTTAVENNPTAAYAWIKLHYGSSFPNVSRGTEKLDYWRKKVYAFIEERAIQSGNAAAFTTQFLAAIPVNQGNDAADWTKR